MTLTTIDAAQDALLDALAERLDAESGNEDMTSGGRLTLGWPLNGPDQLWNSQGDWLWIGEQVDDWTAEPPDLGGTSHHSEEYTLHVLIAAVRAGGTFADARDRVIGLAREVGAVLADDWTLGGVVTQAFPAGGEMTGGFSDGKTGRGAQLDLAVRVSAYPADES